MRLYIIYKIMLKVLTKRTEAEQQRHNLWTKIRVDMTTEVLKHEPKAWMNNEQAVRVATQYASAPVQVDNIFAFIRQVAPVTACWLFKASATSWPLTFWPWKWSESRVTWATSVPILVFRGLSVLELGPMYATDVRQKHRLMPPPYRAEAW